MRIASTTISDAKMKTCEEGSVAPSPTSAKPAHTTPLIVSASRRRRRQTFRLISLRGVATKRRHNSSRMTLAAITSASHRIASVLVAQNIEASEKITARSWMVATALSSLRTNISIISCSNSGLTSLPCVSRSRASRTLNPGCSRTIRGRREFAPRLRGSPLQCCGDRCHVTAPGPGRGPPRRKSRQPGRMGSAGWPCH